MMFLYNSVDICVHLFDKLNAKSAERIIFFNIPQTQWDRKKYNSSFLQKKKLEIWTVCHLT